MENDIVERLRNEWVPIVDAALDSESVEPLHAANCMAALFDIQRLQHDEIERLRAELAETQQAARTWENEAERRSRRYEQCAAELTAIKGQEPVAKITGSGILVNDEGERIVLALAGGNGEVPLYALPVADKDVCEWRCEDDIDLVLSSAADEITRLRAELAEKEACIEELRTKEKNYIADLRVARKELAAIKGQEPMTLDEFTEWLRREMPPGTVIGNSDWWAKRIFRKVAVAPVADKDAERLLGLCKWCAGRLTDAGDDEGSAKVMDSLATMAKGE